MKFTLTLAAALWLALFWVVGARADAPDLSGSADPAMPIVPRSDHTPPLPEARTISILSGQARHYSVTEHRGWLVLDLSVRVRPADYTTLPAFGVCRRGCELRVYIVQERR